MRKIQASSLTNFFLLVLTFTVPAFSVAGTVNGRVTADYDEPVNGLSVCMLERSPTGFGGIVSPQTLVQTQCTRTNATGNYSLVATGGNATLVLIDEKDIQARQLNLIPEYHTGEKITAKLPSQVATFIPSTQDINDLNFKLDAGTRFRGKVTNEQNLPIANILVCVVNLSAPENRCYESNGAGEFFTLPLAFGSFMLFTFNQTGYVDLLHNGQMVMGATAGGAPLPSLMSGFKDVFVNFKLQRGYVLQGTVSDYKNRPTSLGSVCIYGKPPAASLQFLGCSRTNGSFQTPALPPGAYAVLTSNTSEVFGSTTAGELYDGLTQATQTPVLITDADVKGLKLYANSGVNISGKVTDEAGNARAAATVCFHRRNMQGIYAKLNCTLTDINGFYHSALMPAGYYWLSAGKGTTPEVDHNGIAVTPGSPDSLSPALDIGAATTVNFQLKGPVNPSQSRSRALVLAARVIELNHTREWNQPSAANNTAVAAFLQELISVTNAFSELRKGGQIIDEDALGLIRTVTSGLTLALDAAEHGVALNSAGINGTITAVASLIKTLNVYDEELNVSYWEASLILKELAEELLKSAARLQSLQLNVADVHATSTTLGLLIEAFFSQLIQLENNLRYPLEQFAAFTGDAAAPTLHELLAAQGLDPNSLDSQGITAALKANPYLLEKYLRLTAVELNFDSGFRRFAHSLMLPPSTGSVVREYFADIGTSYELIWIKQAGSAAYPLDTIQQALAFDNSEFSVQGEDTYLVVSSGSVQFKVAVGKILLVPPQIPDGLVALPDGSFLLTRNSLSMRVVPAPMNVFALGAELTTAGQQPNLKRDGSMTFDYQGQLVSATMNFQTDSSLHDEAEVAGIIPPANVASNNPGSVFQIRYSNGSSQTLAPFVSATGFFDSLSVRGLAFQLNRQTGVIVMNEGSFRPAFKVSPATAEENAFHQQTKDEEGMAYLPGDFNSDGVVDYKILDGSTTQIVYGVP